MRDQLLEEAADGRRVLDKEKGDQQNEDRLKDPVDQHEHVLHHRGELAGKQTGQIVHRVVVCLAQVDGNAEYRDHVFAIGQILEVAGDRGTLGDERGELLTDDRKKPEAESGHGCRNYGVKGQNGEGPRHAPALGRIYCRVQDQGEDGRNQERAENATDGEPQEDRPAGEDAKEDQRAEIAATPEFVDPAALNHQALTYLKNARAGS